LFFNRAAELLGAVSFCKDIANSTHRPQDWSYWPLIIGAVRCTCLGDPSGRETCCFLSIIHTLTHRPQEPCCPGLEQKRFLAHVLTYNCNHFWDLATCVYWGLTPSSFLLGDRWMHKRRHILACPAEEARCVRPDPVRAPTPCLLHLLKARARDTLTVPAKAPPMAIAM
jgi:hypothetical protein